MVLPWIPPWIPTMVRIGIPGFTMDSTLASTGAGMHSIQGGNHGNSWLPKEKTLNVNKTNKSENKRR